MRKCKVPNCAKKYYEAGFCQMHYTRWRKYKNPYIVKTRGPNKIKRNSGTCIVKDCNNVQRTKNLCNKHYERFRKWGDPNIVKKSSGRNIQGDKNPNWAGGVAEYPNHSLMKKLRLKKLKRAKYRCQICGGKATEIHHKNKNKSDQRLENYIAVCHKCHCASFHRQPRNTSKYRRLIGMSLKEFAKLKHISESSAYHLLKNTDYFSNLLIPQNPIFVNRQNG